MKLCRKQGIILLTKHCSDHVNEEEDSQNIYSFKYLTTIQIDITLFELDLLSTEVTALHWIFHFHLSGLLGKDEPSDVCMLVVRL